ncbi:hypothetical protein [Nocardioides sp. Kera G14]|uniref:hypothetical protein n=1 Tax=Nocardioides sp. Kera G14 TaxID=2884264 RepID=UPI001D12CFAC|nr:hypothetical protein [Nocardioides sp. Kera G14]UDY22531.1 hypothetical protein LH076_10615 [Nocardioides sp. Kera G14]
MSLRPRRWWWLVGAVLAAVIGSWLLRPDTYVATPQQTKLPAARVDLAQASFAAWVNQRATSPALEALRLSHVAATLVTQSGAMESNGSWTAAGHLTWQYDGVDPSPASADVTVRLRTVGGAVTVTGLSAPGRVPVWLDEGATATRSESIVVVTAKGVDHDNYERWADRAVTVVGRVLTKWNGPLVVEVPSDATELEQALGAEVGSYAQVAAITASVDGSSRQDTPVHVFVNPAVMGRLDDRSAQIVLSHEATHAATGAALDTARPLWLSEGFADYVALRDVNVPLTESAGQIAALVRKEGVPSHLPESQDFDAKSDHFGAEYESAWLACMQLAGDAGEAALLRLYRQSREGGDVNAVMTRTIGYGMQVLVRRWGHRLLQLPGARPSGPG